MTNDLIQQKQDLEEGLKGREARIATHKMEIAAERSLIKADQNTIDVLTRLIEKMTYPGPKHPVEGVNETMQP